LRILRCHVPVGVRYITDPGCDVSWVIEPQLRKLAVEFGEEVDFTYVMGGLAREYGPDQTGARLVEWVERAGEGGMPLDPLLWQEGPIRSTYPACMAVKAAAEQGPAGEYLRGLREGLMCFRRKLDTAEALVEEARRAGLDVERFRVDLESHAIVEAFGADLEEARAIPEAARENDGVAEGGERMVFPTLRFGDDGWVFGVQPYEAYRDAALAAGGKATGAPPPGVLDALTRFGRMATAEVEAVCELPGPKAQAELWALAAEWKLKPTRVMSGWLWERA
jgi:predicted DsbA family dithiol-disulfide isomerase